MKKDILVVVLFSQMNNFRICFDGIDAAICADNSALYQLYLYLSGLSELIAYLCENHIASGCTEQRHTVYVTKTVKLLLFAFVRLEITLIIECGIALGVRVHCATTMFSITGLFIFYIFQCMFH